MNRKQFLKLSGLGLTAATAAAVAGCNDSAMPAGEEDLRRPQFEGEWGRIRARFNLDPELIHLAGLLLASHPGTVQQAIDHHRRELNSNPARYVEENFTPREREVRSTAARYLGASTSDVALTHSTTMGIGLVYNGIDVREGQEILTTEHDYHATHDAIGYKVERTGASVRRIALYEPGGDFTEDEVITRLISEIRPETRVLALTWVHSGTGVKIPVRAIVDEVRQINAGRDGRDHVLVCVDGVHGLGVERDSMTDLDCDFFMAGTHKWMFAPRGTGILWGNPTSQRAVTPTIPTFSRGDGWGPRMTPGGFHAFEHWWGVKEAFDFHTEIGKERVTLRIHALNRQFKEGVRDMDHITLYTPMDEALSSGMVCFGVSRMSPSGVVRRLSNRNIIISDTPYSPSYARVAPGLLNSEEEIERVVAAVGDLR